MKLKNIVKYYRCNRKDIDINELTGILNTNENIVLLDVRSPQEYKEGHLNGAINIPLYELELACKRKIGDRNRTILVYCQSGIRSKRAIKILYKNGFNNLYNLKGGLDAI